MQGADLLPIPPMPPHPEALEASYRVCRQISRRAGSTFWAGFLLLPKPKRRAMEALYAFMRHTDDLADAPTPPDVRRAALAQWRLAVEQALQGNLPPSAFPLPPSPLLALADSVRCFQIPAEHLWAVIEGVEMDLVPRRYETFDELERYCEHVASAVGLACIYIWGFRGSEAFESARQAGVALQLTNILRDLREDAAAGRVYLPQADLRQCGYGEEQLVAGVANDAFLRLMRLEVERAERFYRGGRRLAPWLMPDGRRIFGLMTDSYQRLLRRIARHPADVFRRRVRLGRLTRLGMFMRWMFLSHGP
jgi:15-cis-phytoene synthase